MLADARDGSVEKEAYVRYRRLARRLRRRYDDLCRRAIFEEVDSAVDVDVGNPVLHNDARYRTVLQAWLALVRGVALPETMARCFRAPLAEMPEIYECWCLLRLADAIVSARWSRGALRGRPTAGDVSTERNRLILEFRSPRGTRAELLFNFSSSVGDDPPYRSYSVGLRPDFALRVGKRMVVFDAKYRVDLEILAEPSCASASDWEREREERRGRFKLADLYKMHTYRDALRGSGCSIDWVLTLYPGTETGTGREVRFYCADLSSAKHDPDAVARSAAGGVGAIPCRPDDRQRALDSFVASWLEVAEADARKPE